MKEKLTKEERIKLCQNNQLKKYMKSTLARRNLPEELYNILNDYLLDDKYCDGLYHTYNWDMARDFRYSMTNKFGDETAVTVIEKRRKFHPSEGEPAITTYIDNFTVKYTDGKYITENLLAVNDPENINSCRVLFNNEEAINEYTNGEKQKMPYTEEEIKFIKDLKFVNQESRVLKTAIENDCWYTLKYFYPEEDYVRFSVGKDSDVFDYIFVLIAKNGRTAVIEGNNKEATIKYYVNQERNLEIPSEEFTYYNKTIASKLQIILAELRKQGVDIQETHSITRTRKNTN